MPDPTQNPGLSGFPVITPAAFERIEQRVLQLGGRGVLPETSPIQAGVIIGRQEVLNILRKEFTVQP